MKNNLKEADRRIRTLIKKIRIRRATVMEKLISGMEIVFFHSMFPFSYAKIPVRRKNRKTTYRK